MKNKEQVNKEFKDATDECHRLVVKYLMQKKGFTKSEAVEFIKKEGSKPLQFDNEQYHGN